MRLLQQAGVVPLGGEHLPGLDLGILKYPLWEVLVGFKNETCPVFWSGPCRTFVRGAAVWRQPQVGDKDRQQKGLGCW